MVEKIYLKSKMKVYILNTLKSGKKIKKLLNTRFHSQSIYDDKYIKPLVKTLHKDI